MKIYLETKRLILREFTTEDVDNLYDLDSDPEVTRFIDGGLPPDREDIRTRIVPLFLAYYQKYAAYGYWAAIEKKSGVFLGWFHFRPAYDNASDIELGYRLKRSAWGKGYATELSGALIQQGFANLGIRRVTASALLANRASTRVMEKVGMKVTHYYREERFPGEDKSAVKYALRREDYLPEPPSPAKDKQT